jgi:predicted dehydrogenase
MRIGMVGLGFMGSTHLREYKSIPDAQVVAVFSRDERSLSGDLSHIKGNIGGPGEKMDFSNVRKYREIDALLADADIDAVDICLPTHFHADTAIKALRAGKHVLVEKPLAVDGSEADRVIEEGKRSGRILMCAQVLRFFPAYAGLIDEIKTAGPARLGIFRRRCAAPFWGSGWLTDRSKSGGGVFDLLIHDVDIVVKLFGVPKAMSAVGHEDLDRGIDVVTATFHYESGLDVVVTGGWHHPKEYPFSMEYTVVCDEATFDYSSTDDHTLVYQRDGTSRQLHKPAEDAFEAELRYFVECCRDNLPPERCRPEESAQAVKLAIMMRDIRARNGEKVPCQF